MTFSMRLNQENCKTVKDSQFYLHYTQYIYIYTLLMEVHPHIFLISLTFIHCMILQDPGLKALMRLWQISEGATDPLCLGAWVCGCIIDIQSIWFYVLQQFRGPWFWKFTFGTYLSHIFEETGQTFWVGQKKSSWKLLVATCKLWFQIFR